MLALKNLQSAQRKPEEMDLCNPDIQVHYEQDIFLKAWYAVQKYGYAVVVDAFGNACAVIEDVYSLYSHSYLYTGGLDMDFLNRYDCIFFTECNEFAVELCNAALPHWNGKRLVLVGSWWEELLEYLPDLPQVECFYEPVLTDERIAELNCENGLHTLYVVKGVSHEEPLSRYQSGIMYYDEIMALTFLFCNYKELGKDNPDKDFFVVDAYYGSLGLFAIYAKAVVIARYVKNKGMIPVIRLTQCHGSHYSNQEGEDIWSKFFSQPEGYSFDDIQNSQHVYFSPGIYNGSVMCHIMDAFSDSRGMALVWPDGEQYSEAVRCYIREKSFFLPYPDATLGVLARGTDFAGAKPQNHPIHATPEMLCEKIDETLEERKELKYIYVATEDAGYLEYFKQRYPNILCYTDQERYTTKPGEFLYQMHRNMEQKRDGFLLGAEYILSVHLLSKCNSLIASGGCSGLGEALKENNHHYQSVYVFNLGINK